MDFYVFYNKPSAIQNKAQTLYSLVELDKIYYNTIFMNLRNTISTQTPHPGYFTQIFYFFKISQKFKEETRNIRIYSQVMAVCVQRTEFCQGRRDLTRTLQRITSK